MGREEYRSVGTQELRWWTSNLLRFQTSTCHVVESELFDIIIGKKTIDRLGLYKVRRGMIAAFISRQPSFKSKQALTRLRYLINANRPSRRHCRRTSAESRRTARKGTKGQRRTRSKEERRTLAQEAGGIVAQK